MTIHPRHGRHGIGEIATVECPEAGDPEFIADADGVGEVEAVGEEFGEGGGGDDDAGGEAGKFDEVEGGKEGLAAGGGEAVIWGGGEGDEVDLGGGFGDGYGAAGVIITCRDGDCEEGLTPWRSHRCGLGMRCLGSV